MRNRHIINSRILAFVAAVTTAMMSIGHAEAGPVAIGGDLIFVPTPASLNYNGHEFSGVINEAPIIFSELTNVTIPVFSALPASNPILVSHGLTPATFNGLDYVDVEILASGTYPPLRSRMVKFRLVPS